MKQILLILSASFLFSQEFGKNIVQYDDFEWHYVQSKHFDIYFNDPSGYHSKFLIEQSELAYDKISTLMNWDLRDRVPIIVYKSHNNFQQTNVVGIYMPEGVGGVTELLKNRVVIPFDGSIDEFRDVLFHELVHAFINDCVYGGSLKQMMKNSIKTRIPLWMNEGLAEYVSDKWSANSDMWIRDLVLGGNLPNINDLNGYWAYRGGQSVWNFITQKWGEESIAEIIYQIKKSGDIDKGILNALSTDLNGLQEMWHKYLKTEYWSDINNMDEVPDIARRLTNHTELKNTYNVAPSLSPNGDQIALFSNKDGPMGLYLISSIDGKFEEHVVEGERSSEFEELHILKPGISWSPDGKEIVFAAKSGKSDALFIIDLDNWKRKKIRFNVEGIFRPSWSPDGNYITFVGNNGNASDIYLYDILNDSLKNITGDWFSDDQPTWSNDSKEIYFISNRSDFLTVESKDNYSPEDKSTMEQMDIYKINITTKKINRITNTDYNESYPCMSNNDNTLAYISDRNGINNIYLKNGDNASQPITNVLTGITQLSWTSSSNQLIFTGFHNGGYDTYMLSNPLELLDQNIQTVNANWKNIDENLNELKPRDKKVDVFREYKNYIFFDLAEDTTEVVSLEAGQEASSTSLFEMGYQHKILKYKTRYSLDFAQGNVTYGFDTRYGGGGSGMANIIFSDILGDHIISISTEMQIRIKSSDYLVTYSNLSKRIDMHYMFYHFADELIEFIEVPFGDGEVADWFPTYRKQYMGTNIKGEFAFSRFKRIETGIDIRYSRADSLIWTSPWDFDESKDVDREKIFLIPGLKFVHDKALWSQYEIYPTEGSRYYIEYNTSILDTKSKSLMYQSLMTDWRFYSPLFNGVTAAVRFFGGSYWGKGSDSAATFRVGGTPYLPIQRDSYSYIYDLYGEENSVYQNEFIMPIRGVPIGAKYGKNVLVMNAEIRIPFLMYYFPAIKYFGKINAVLFSDIGVVWDDDFIFYSDNNSWDDIDQTDGYIVNSLSQQLVNGETVTQVSRTYKPGGWVWTYGFGPRFIFLGLPWKLDYAWQFNPHTGKSSSRRWYLSIGFDF